MNKIYDSTFFNGFIEIQFLYHTIIHFKWTVRWLLVASQSRALISRVNFRTFSLSPPETLLIAITPPPLSSRFIMILFYKLLVFVLVAAIQV